jgi:hypothetical protein
MEPEVILSSLLGDREGWILGSLMVMYDVTFATLSMAHCLSLGCASVFWNWVLLLWLFDDLSGTICGFGTLSTGIGLNVLTIMNAYGFIFATLRCQL